jgi:Cys-tRNA synthase (O-phospho-L-seryl-tRNA:Cys-tRNA synthase)
MKKVFLIGMVLVIVTSLVSQKIGLRVGIVYVLFLGLIFLSAMYDYFSTKRACRSIEEILQVRKEKLNDFKDKRTALLKNHEKIESLIEDLSNMPENQEAAEKMIDEFKKTQAIIKEVDEYAGFLLKRAEIEANIALKFYVPLLKKELEDYQKREYLFYYQPSERVLEVINNL